MNINEIKKYKEHIKKYYKRKMSLSFLHGYLSAVAVAPNKLEISKWLPFLLNYGKKKLVFNSKKEADAFALPIMELCDYIYKSINKKTFLPFHEKKEENDFKSIQQWCEAFTLAFGLWENYEKHLDDKNFQKIIGPVFSINSPDKMMISYKILKSSKEQFIKESIEDLPDAIMALPAYFINYKKTSAITVDSETKIGRNDPCPCGSGKKYKKCCAM